ncbi:MAG: 5'/3'-nucleotidase SurE [Dysgonamonadaceae bacterium]|jgi:5'-nucleotidase|nr:5'/3'-nucleotidase SurE [Dysgonamonadaceae bacterium]
MKEKKTPLILISNDDGVHANGIKELIQALRPLGELLVVAPDGPRSGMSGAISSIDPLHIQLLEADESMKIYSCSGTPVDCIKLGINELAERQPDIVVSGINHGSNSSLCVLYSGTVGAALEGCVFGIPSVALSLTDYDLNADFKHACRYGRQIVEEVIREGLPAGICLNVNIPAGTTIQGIKICTQTKGRWIKEFYKTRDEAGEELYWLTGEFDNTEPENDKSDEWALANGYVAVVPIQIDMTAYTMIERLHEILSDCR